MQETSGRYLITGLLVWKPRSKQTKQTKLRVWAAHCILLQKFSYFLSTLRLSLKSTFHPVAIVLFFGYPKTESLSSTFRPVAKKNPVPLSKGLAQSTGRLYSEVTLLESGARNLRVRWAANFSHLFAAAAANCGGRLWRQDTVRQITNNELKTKLIQKSLSNKGSKFLRMSWLKLAS